MKRIYLTAVCLFVAWLAGAQELPLNFEKMQEIYEKATLNERVKLDADYRKFEKGSLEEQVKDIGGIPFGVSKRDGAILLQTKYGDREVEREGNVMTYRNISYAGMDFDAVHFVFQSDGTDTYFHSCVFVLTADTKEEAAVEQGLLYNQLAKKYELSNARTKEGFELYEGGVSPLWDGHWYHWNESYSFAVHLDVIAYDQEVVDMLGLKYATRLIYGPFNYAGEEF